MSSEEVRKPKSPVILDLLLLGSLEEEGSNGKEG